MVLKNIYSLILVSIQTKPILPCRIYFDFKPFRKDIVLCRLKITSIIKTVLFFRFY